MINYKRRLKRYLSFILVVSLLLGLIPQSAYATGVVDVQDEMVEEQQEDKDILSHYGMVAQKNNIQLSCSQAYFNTNLYCGKDFSCSGSKVTIDGKIETSGKVNAWCHEFTVAEQTEKAEPIILPDIRSGIESKSDVWEEQEYYMNVNGEAVSKKVVDIPEVIDYTKLPIEERAALLPVPMNDYEVEYDAYCQHMGYTAEKMKSIRYKMVVYDEFLEEYNYRKKHYGARDDLRMVTVSEKSRGAR